MYSCARARLRNSSKLVHELSLCSYCEYLLCEYLFCIHLFY